MQSLSTEVDQLKRNLLQKRSASMTDAPGIRLRPRWFQLQDTPRSASLNNIDVARLSASDKGSHKASPMSSQTSPSTPTSDPSFSPPRSPEETRRQTSLDDAGIRNLRESVAGVAALSSSTDGELLGLVHEKISLFALPDSLILNILRRLQATDLLRFGRTSKLGMQIIQDRSLCCPECAAYPLILLHPDPDSINAYIRILCRCQQFETRSALIGNLGQLPETDKIMSIIVHSLLNDPDRSIRSLCITILSAKYTEKEPTVKALEKIAAGDPDPTCKNQAAACVRYLSQLRQEAQKKEGDEAAAAVVVEPLLILDDGNGTTSSKAVKTMESVIIPVPKSILD